MTEIVRWRELWPPLMGSEPYLGDVPLTRLRERARAFVAKQKYQAIVERREWIYYNTFIGRRVERHRDTGEFRIIGGQVQVSL